eukprot:8745113-Pyramimonas_sp.AAC.1
MHGEARSKLPLQALKPKNPKTLKTLHEHARHARRGFEHKGLWGVECTLAVVGTAGPSERAAGPLSRDTAAVRNSGSP